MSKFFKVMIIFSSIFFSGFSQLLYAEITYQRDKGIFQIQGMAVFQDDEEQGEFLGYYDIELLQTDSRIGILSESSKFVLSSAQPSQFISLSDTEIQLLESYNLESIDLSTPMYFIGLDEGYIPRIDAGSYASI